MKKRSTIPNLCRLLLAGLLSGGVAACGGGAGTASEQDTAAIAGAADTAPRAGMPAMPGMHADPATMQRHAEEADSMVAAMRAHLQQMRQLPAGQQHERVGDHVAQVSRMLAMMDRHVREMDMGMDMDDEHMGEMMGMSAEEHRRMMEETRTLRREAEQLQVASEAELRQRMPEHLERLERFVAMIERSAAHMRMMH